MPKETIFETLDKEEVCYSVGVNYIRSRKQIIDLYGKQYFIIAERIPALRMYSFKNSENEQVFEREMSKSEIIEFKERQDEFVKVYDNLHGKVFELKNNSLKSKINEKFTKN